MQTDSNFLEDFTHYCDEFKYYSYKASLPNWWLRTVFYLPIGAIIENYWIHKMSKCNREYEKKWLNPEQDESTLSDKF